MGPKAIVNIVSALVRSGVPSGSNAATASLHGVGSVGSAAVVVGASVGATVAGVELPAVDGSLDEHAPITNVETTTIEKSPALRCIRGTLQLFDSSKRWVSGSNPGQSERRVNRGYRPWP